MAVRSIRALFLGLSFLVVFPVFSQPYGSWLSVPSGHGYVSIPHAAAFDFTNGFTFEAWVNGSDAGPCTSIAGKDYTRAWWVGICGNQLRSYLRGVSSQQTSGTVPANVWTHIAVTWDGTTHKHFIDGEEVMSRAESGPMTTSSTELRIGSDTAWAFTPQNFQIDEVRFWNVARTRDEIRSTINTTITSAQPGLVALYALNSNTLETVAGRTGTLNGTAAYATGAITGSCTATATSLCLGGNRFGVSVRWLTSEGSGVGTVVPGAAPNSGLFWFFTSDNWELMVKALNGCGINNRKWVFSAGATNVHYQLAVTDALSGQSRRYFNYQGVTAITLTDTEAFATCP
jgi:hypothetical protein